MQYGVDNGVCKDDGKCKNEADRKMLKSLDAVPYKDKQWSHFLARNMINTKQKHDIGPSKTEKGGEWENKLATTISKGITQTYKEGFYLMTCYC